MHRIKKFELETAEDHIKEVKLKLPCISEPNCDYLREDEVIQFQKLIKEKKSEREIDNHLRVASDLLTAFLHIYRTGHHRMIAIPQAIICNTIPGYVKGKIPDWLLCGDSSDGETWYFVELKSPADKIFINKDPLYFSNKCNKGINQLISYLDFADKHQTSFRDMYKMPGFRNPKGVLIIGSREDLSEEMIEQKRSWNNLLSGKIEIRTWDAILDAVLEKWNYVKPRIC